MKKLFLLPLLVLSLTACGGQDNGKEVDLSSEEGVATLKTSVKNVAKGYAETKIEALGVETEVKNSSLALTGNVEYNGIKVSNANISLSNLNTKLSAFVKNGEAQAKLEDTNGTLAIKGAVSVDTTNPEDEESEGMKFDVNLNETVSLKDVNANVFHKGETTYIDYGSAGIRSVLTDASAIVNKVLTAAYGQELPPEAQMDLNALLDTMTGSTTRKIAVATGTFNLAGTTTIEYNDEVASGIDESIDSYVKLDLLKSVFTLKTFNSGKFELGFGLNKENLVKLLESIGENLPEDSAVSVPFAFVSQLAPTLLKKFDLSAKLTINEKGLLVNEETKADIELDTTEISSLVGALVEGLKKLELNLKIVEEQTAKIFYNDEVSFTLPSDEELRKFTPVSPVSQEN